MMTPVRARGDFKPVFCHAERRVGNRGGDFHGFPGRVLAEALTRFWKVRADEMDGFPEDAQRGMLGAYALIYAQFATRHPAYAERTARMMARLPMELLIHYARAVALSIERALPQITEALLDPRNLELIRRHLLTRDWMRMMPTLRIAGVEFADSALINRVMVKEPHSAVITDLTHSYSYFDIEKRLLEKGMPRVVASLAGAQTLQMVELGPGVEKLQVMLAAMKRAGRMPKDLFLVDCNQTALEATMAGVAGYGTQTRIVPVPFSFEELRTKPIGLFDDSPVLVSYLGTTFCNLMPGMNFEIFKALRARGVVLGIYLMPEGDEIYPMMFAYSGDAMQAQAKIGAMLLGVSGEDIDGKCSYRVNLARLDMSDRYGPEFLSVGAILALFDVSEPIESGLGKTYDPGSTLGGFFSIKYTARQIELLAAMHGFRPSQVGLDPQSQVALYHLEQQG